MHVFVFPINNFTISGSSGFTVQVIIFAGVIFRYYVIFNKLACFFKITIYKFSSIDAHIHSIITCLDFHTKFSVKCAKKSTTKISPFTVRISLCTVTSRGLPVHLFTNLYWQKILPVSGFKIKVTRVSSLVSRQPILISNAQFCVCFCITPLECGDNFDAICI